MGFHIVTGAFGYSGKYIASKLLEQGMTVQTITNSVNRPNPFGEKVKVHPFHFDEPEKLESTLKGADVLYNTYWVRFNHKNFTHSSAVDNTLRLFEAAKRAGVQRIIHVSITNPSMESHLEYFNGKARLEQALIHSGLSYCILRPTVIFGKEDILVNNIAWILRRLPVFGVFGDGSYRLQPISVDDFAELAVEQGQSNTKTIIDAIGPETFTFRSLVETIGQIIGKRRPIISVTPGLGYAVASVIGKIVGDVFLTREEIEGLMKDLLYTSSAPVGKTKLTEWAKENANSLGIRYASELFRRQNRNVAY
jgi:nucleoside-diphosphate-sugar epimerase